MSHSDQFDEHITYLVKSLTKTNCFGEVGPSLLHLDARNILSILKLTLEEKSDVYKEAMQQICVNSQINYVSSIDESKSTVLNLITD